MVASYVAVRLKAARASSSRSLALDGAVVAAHLLDHARVLVGGGDDGDELVVLGGRADHAGPADIDVLDRLFERALGFRDRLLERVEVDADQVDRLDAVLAHGLDVFLLVPQAEQRAVDLRVQGLDPAVHHLGKAGDGIDAHDVDSRLRELLGRAPGADDLDPHLRQGVGETDDPGLVRNTDQSGPDCDVHINSFSNPEHPSSQGVRHTCSYRAGAGTRCVPARRPHRSSRRPCWPHNGTRERNSPNRAFGPWHYP